MNGNYISIQPKYEVYKIKMLEIWSVFNLYVWNVKIKVWVQLVSYVIVQFI